jgi:SNF2 family DNA or RNA helicase
MPTLTATRESATAASADATTSKHIARGYPDFAEYPFRGVPKPFEHQVVTAQFILDTPKCFVWNDIGSGKSWTAVWATDFLASLGEIKHVLIIAPLSTLEVVWKRTFFHLNASLDVEVLKGTAERRKTLLNRDRGLSPYKVSIINPDAIHLLADVESDVDMVICDEHAMFRNAKARRVKGLIQVCKDVPRLIFMSGSPFPESPTDIFATAKIIAPDRMPKWFGQFRDLTMKKINQFKWVALPDAQETISLLLKGYHIRFRRDECIDLPPSHHAEIEVEASKQQKDLIRAVRKEAVALVEDGQVNAANEAVVISKILQIASGAVRYTREDGTADVITTDAKGKFDALEEILEASSQPVIVFAPFTAVIKRIEDWLKAKDVSYLTVEGSTPPVHRLTAFDAIQNGTIRVLVAHPQALAHGITLTTSNVVVWFSPIYSHEVWEQANGRITRPGQIRTQYIISLTCTGLESRVLQRLKEKKALQGLLLNYLQREEV